MNRKKLYVGIAVAVTVVVVVAVVVLNTVGGYNVVSSILNAGQALISSVPPWKWFWVSALVALVPGFFIYRHYHPSDDEESADDESDRESFQRWSYERDPGPGVPWLQVIGVVAVLCVGLFFSISSVNRHGHDVAHAQVNRVLTVVKGEEPPSFELRDPYDLAVTRLRRSVGDASGYTVPTANVWRFDVDGEPQTCGLRVPEANASKRPMGGVVCVDDAGHVSDAEFTGQVPTWKVFFGGLRLAGVVNDVFPRGSFSEGDVYGFIDDDGPHMVVPVTRMMGGLDYHVGWVGAVVFDADGSVRKVTDPSELPGPVVGESVADEVLNALSHRSGFMASKRASTAFDLGEGDNVRHFMLKLADGGEERLVTLLTPRGDSETVTAVLVIDPRTVVDGWPKAQLHMLRTKTEDGVSRASVAEVVDLVKQRYGTAMQLSDSQGVLEATPADADELVVSIGSNQRVFARVTVDMLSRETCVYRPDGTEVRCDAPDSAPLSLGSLRGLFNNGDDVPAEGASDPAPSNGDAVASVPTDLSSLSDEELSDLLRDVADELDARTATGAQSTP